MAMDLLKQPNDIILDALRYNASPQYQQRVPEATQAGVMKTIGAITRYTPAMNEFVNALVNQIGTLWVRNETWTNPLREFIQLDVEYGDTIAEVGMGLLRAHHLDLDTDASDRTIFGTELPPVIEHFHRINRQEFYKVSISNNAVKRAFTNGEQLGSFVGGLMAAPYESNQYDEYLHILRLFRVAEAMGALYHVHIPDVADPGSGMEESKGALRIIRGLGNTLNYRSSRYNSAHLPTTTRAEELILFTTTEFAAAIDVEALAALFNVARADVQYRVIALPSADWGMGDIQAILCDRRFLVLANHLYEGTQIFDPVTQAGQTNHFLHVWQTLSFSRMVNAVALTIGAGDDVTEVQAKVTSVVSITLDNSEGNVVGGAVQRGGMARLLADVAVDTTPDGYEDDFKAVQWSVSGHTSPATYITQTGVLHVARDETATSVTVRARSVYLDPANPRLDGPTNTLVVQVSGINPEEWPIVAAATLDASQVKVADVAVTGVSPTFAVTLAGVTSVSASDLVVTSDEPATVTNVKVTGSGSTRTITFDYDPGLGAALVAYTVTVTLA